MGENCFLAPNCSVIGDVEMGEGSSVWFGSVVRGDVHYIKMGKRVNIQDLCTLHVTNVIHPLNIGDDVSVGHNAVLHGCTIGDRVLVGTGAVVLDGAYIGDDSIVAAGAVVPEGTTFPPRSLLMGVPAKRVRNISPEEGARIAYTTDSYLALGAEYLSQVKVDNTESDA